MVYSIWQFQPLKVWTQCALNTWCALHLSPLLPSGEWKCIALTGVYEWHSNVWVCVGIDTHTQSVCLSVAFRHCVKTAKHLVKVLSLPSLIPVFIQYFNCVTVNEHELSMFTARSYTERVIATASRPSDFLSMTLRYRSHRLECFENNFTAD